MNISKRVNTIIINRLRISLIVIAACLTSENYAQTAGTVMPLGEGISAKKFFSSTVDKNNTVWFLTESGIVSFDGSKWILHNKNKNVTSSELQSVVYDSSPSGSELWFATHHGATSASLPVDELSGVNSYQPGNSKILSEKVFALAVGKGGQKWFGTDKGISAVKNNKWMTNSYEDKYPESLFSAYPITSMAATTDGDTLYIGTKGGGVLRVFRNSDVDAVSGASEYAAWGPILMASDTVYCVHVSSNGVQWFGTDKGVSKHVGYKTLEGWAIYTVAEGLVDDNVQAINSDNKGNLYFGTKKGLSVFDGAKFTTYQTGNGLASNNILTIAVDNKGVVWIGTDNGVTCFKEGKFQSYR